MNTCNICGHIVYAILYVYIFHHQNVREPGIQRENAARLTLQLQMQLHFV